MLIIPGHRFNAYVGACDAGSNKIHARVSDEEGWIIDERNSTRALAKNMRRKFPFFDEKSLRAVGEDLREISAMFQKYKIPVERAACVGTAAMRDAQNAIDRIFIAKGKEAAIKVSQEINFLHESISPYRLIIIPEKMEEDLVAEVTRHDFYQDPSCEMRELRDKHERVIMAHCGGHSLEVALFLNGKIEFQTTLPFGLYPSTEDILDSAGKPLSYSQLFVKQLHDHLPANTHASLFLPHGGIWRNTGELTCLENTHILSRKTAERRLEWLAARDESYFTRRGQHRRAEHLANGSQTLLDLARYADVKEIAFLQGKMVTVLTRELAAEHLIYPKRESQLLASLSALPQPRHV